ncbi:hypothetical protein AMECASPLE_022164 [Ameca splendens]|uniref:Uncharacterized protein n=1 Tax=Ameca splendens TaxID=208324 RepID=A0ABV0XST6_9TELE
MRLLLSFSQAGKTASLGFVETASLLGTSLGQFASAGLREKDRMTPLDPVEELMSVCQQSDISALSPPIPMITGVEEVGPLERGCFYAASGIMGSLPLQFDWLCRK